MVSTSTRILTLLSTLIITNVHCYFVDQQFNCSNVQNAINPPTPYVSLLGKFNSSQQCIEACVNKKCDSYTYFLPASDNYSNECWSYINNTIWVPHTNNVQSDCGRIIYPCVNDSDCSLNGQCNKATGNCTCDSGWNGYKCGSLALLPANKSAGYLSPFGSFNMTSWGGAVAYSNVTDKYVMLVSDMQYNCGINSWRRNCEIIFAETVDNNWNSEYKRKSTLIIPFSCEPDLTYAPDTDEYVFMYLVNTTWDEIPPCICSDGHTTNCKTGQNVSESTALRTIKATDISNGYDISKWSKPILLEAIGHGDTNFAAVINDDSSLIGMMRYWRNGPGSLIHLVTATNWKDNSTYKLDGSLLFPYLVPTASEDMYLYKDCRGYFHALFHNMDPSDDQKLCGGHAFSVDGIHWKYGGAAFGNVVQFTDGTEFVFSRRERPHLIFDKDKCTPIALTSAAEYNGDKSFTLLQPIQN